MVIDEILSRTTFSKKLTVHSFFSNDEKDDNVGIELLLAQEIFDSAYPPHQTFGFINNESGVEMTDRQLLWDYWVQPWNSFVCQPLHLIRLYFGEKLGFYFAWLGFFTSWLVLPSIAGVFVTIYGIFMVGRDIPTKEICDDLNRTAAILMCPLCNYGNCKSWYLHESCTYSKVNDFFLYRYLVHKRNF